MTVVTNHETGQMIWAAKGKSAEVLDGLFDLLGPERCARIRLVSIDMSAAFEKAVRDRLPNAEVVFDRFHVVQLLGNAIDQVRRDEMRKATGEERSALKSTGFVLLKNPWNLRDAEEAKLSELARMNHTLFRSYLVKESFQDIYDSSSVRQADRRFKRWYQSAVHSRIQPLVRFARTVAAKWPGIRRYFEYRLTNAVAEGCNNKIRMLSHRAFGFHTAEALIAMAFLCTSAIAFHLSAMNANMRRSENGGHAVWSSFMPRETSIRAADPSRTGPGWRHGWFTGMGYSGTAVAGGGGGGVGVFWAHTLTSNGPQDNVLGTTVSFGGGVNLGEGPYLLFGRGTADAMGGMSGSFNANLLLFSFSVMTSNGSPFAVAIGPGRNSKIPLPMFSTHFEHAEILTNGDVWRFLGLK